MSFTPTGPTQVRRVTAPEPPPPTTFLQNAATASGHVANIVSSLMSRSPPRIP